MAVESKRGCGYREVHGLYLVTDGISFECDRLPISTNLCKCCGNFIREFQGIQSIDPLQLLGEHGQSCVDPSGCFACWPDSPREESAVVDGIDVSFDVEHFLMWVGRSYYTKDSFMKEVEEMGVSKRLPTTGVPNGLVVGRSWVFLAMRHIMDEFAEQPDGTVKKGHGIFMVFKAKRLEYLIWESEDTPEYRKELEARGLTVVAIPDGDEDHAPSRRKPRGNIFAKEALMEDMKAKPPDEDQGSLGDFFDDLEEFK